MEPKNPLRIRYYYDYSTTNDGLFWAEMSVFDYQTYRVSIGNGSMLTGLLTYFQVNDLRRQKLSQTYLLHTCETKTSC